MDLAKEVSTRAAYPWRDGQLDLDRGRFATAEPKYRVVAYDYGVKRNILRMLAERGCDITVVPAQTPAAETLALKPDGIFLSNGPGDPQPCDYAIAAIGEFLAKKIPLYGICLGHQLLRSEEHTSELQSLMRTSYAVFCLKNKTTKTYNR